MFLCRLVMHSRSTDRLSKANIDENRQLGCIEKESAFACGFPNSERLPLPTMTFA